MRLINPDDRAWSAFNPSIGYSSEVGYAMTIRSSNYVLDSVSGSITVTNGGYVKNKLWFADLDQSTLEITAVRQIQFAYDEYPLVRGIEDAKLFWRDGSWYFSGIMLEREHTNTCRVCLYQYDYVNNIATLVKKWEGPDVFRPEKNWMFPYKENPNFDAIYGATGIVKDDKLVAKFLNEKSLGGLRGNTNLWELEDGTYLAIMHTLYLKRSTYYGPKKFSNAATEQRRYSHQFVRIDQYGSLVGLSPEFIFDELDIEFAAGLVEKDGYYIITYGSKDITAHMATIPVEEVHKRIVSIGTLNVEMYVQPMN
jgi:hypothetical protein